MTQYISKSALVAEIERRKQVAFGWMETAPNDAIEAEIELCDNILSFIDTLEVKDVDLDKEIKEVQHKYKTIDEYEGYPCTMYANGIEWIAKHFFELGLKAQKGKD